jgi:hypothetical protein
MSDFEQKLASAGEMFEKLANEQGLSIEDFSDDEAADILTQIMDGGAGPAIEPKTASVETPAPAAPVAAPPAAAPSIETKLASDPVLYAQAFQEVTKQAEAAGVDVKTVDPKELHEAVVKQASLMSDPAYQAKVAALNEKIAEADMLGRVMAHSYVDELAKIAAKTAGEEQPKDEEKEKQEKKAAFVAALRAKQAGEMPPAFAAHVKGKGEGKDDEGKDKDDEKKKEEAEKKASLITARVQAHLLSQGIDPTTGEKLAAADQSEIDQAALAVLKAKGWV